jgi:Fic family protein
MGALEKFLHDEPIKTPVLIKAALAHAQFESIHPFLDGNGRLGRLLITLILCNEGVIKEPMLYLSLYLKTHRQEYYDLLQNLRIKGDWEKWLRFFVSGIIETSELAVKTAKTIVKLFKADQEKISMIGKSAGSASIVHNALQQKPLASIAELADMTKLSVPTVTSVLSHLQDAGIVNEVTGYKRGRLFRYDQYLAILDEGTEPL